MPRTIGVVANDWECHYMICLEYVYDKEPDNSSSKIFIKKILIMVNLKLAATACEWCCLDQKGFESEKQCTGSPAHEDWRVDSYVII